MASTLVDNARDFAAAEDIPADATEVFARHGDFVWRTLERLGVRGADREDLLQEVFMVVHRQLGGFAGQARLTTWLYAIALRVVSTHRRRAWVRRESPRAELPDARASTSGPEEALGEAQERQQLCEVLDLMSLEKRALFVMYELDQLPCQEIAETLGIPVGTVHSRLHAARQEFQSACARWQARARAARSRRSLVLASGTGLWLGWRPLALAATLGVASVATVVATRSALPAVSLRAPSAAPVARPQRSAMPPVLDPPARAVHAVESPPAEPRASEASPQRRARVSTAPRRPRAPAIPPSAAGALSDTLADELALLGRARAELDRDPHAALASVDEHARKFAAGKLVIERELLALDVLQRLARPAEAHSRAERLLGRARGTIYEARVRARLHFE
jgi:RNA polymerase sigma-70 factor (ECF subfamily)